MGYRLGNGASRAGARNQATLDRVFLLGLALVIGHPILASLLGKGWWWTMLLRSDDLEAAGWHF